MKIGKYWIVIGVCAAVAAGIIAAKRGGRIAASYVVLEEKDALETVLANGRVAGRKITTLAFSKGGALARVMARDGMRVQRGDTLAMLDDRAERAVIAQRRSALSIAGDSREKLATTDAVQAREMFAQALRKEEEAKKHLERISTLYSSGGVSAAELESARQAHELAVSQTAVAKSNLDALATTQSRMLDAQTEQARALLTQAEIELAKCFLRAPEDGKVLELKASAGEFVAAGQTVCSFLPFDTTTHVELLVDENEVSSIRIGQRAVVGVYGDGNGSMEAVVRDILPVIDPARGTATVQLALAAPQPQLFPDQAVSAQIIIGAIPAALVVEQRFLKFTDSGARVFVLRRGRALETAVSVRDLGNGTFLAGSGLAAGDTLLLAPKLSNGDRVKLMSPADAAPGRS